MTRHTPGPVERAFASIGARIDSFGNRSELGGIFRKERDAARRGIDELHVQSALGKMELHDVLVEIRDHIDSALALIEHDVKAITDTPWHDLPERVHITE